MTYLDTAGEGIPPVQVGVALNHYFRDAQAGMDGRSAHAIEWQAVKALAGEMFGLSSDRDRHLFVELGGIQSCHACHAPAAG